MPCAYFESPDGRRGVMTYQHNYRIIDSTGKEWNFEWHSHFGPFVLKKDGDPRLNQPGEKSPYWVAIKKWSEQGRVVDEDGLCVWDINLVKDNNE